MRVLFKTGGRIWRSTTCAAPYSFPSSPKSDDRPSSPAQNPDQIPHVRNTSLVWSDLSRVGNSPSSRSGLFPVLIFHDVGQFERQEIDAVSLTDDLGQLPAIHAEAIRHHGHRR